MKKSRVFSVIIIALISVYLLAPALATLIYSFSTEWTGLLPKALTARNYVDLFSQPEFFRSIGRTIFLCVVPIAISTLAVLLAMYSVMTYFPMLEKYMQIICTLPYAIQGVILSVSILSLYARASGFFSNRVVLLIGAYCIIILPYVYQGIRNSMYAVNMPMLMDAAEILGASKLTAFFRVIVPNLLSGIIVTSLLSMALIFGEYVLVHTLTGSSFQNVQVYLFYEMKYSSTRASAIFMISFLVIMLITVLVLYLQSKVGDAQAEVWEE